MSWSDFVTNADSIARCAAIVVATVGVVAFLAVTLGWRWIQAYYRESAARVVVAAFRAVAASSAILSRSSPAAGGDWIDQPGSLTLAASIAGYLVWEVTGIVGDAKHKASKEATAAAHLEEIGNLTRDRDDATLEATRLEWLLAFLREPIGHQLQRVRRVVAQTAGSRVSVQHVREGLGSGDQIRTILESLTGLFRTDVISAGGSSRQNFRVGLYVEQDGRMEPRDAFDAATKSHTPFASPRTHPERFRLDAEVGPAHAVRCVREGQILIVPDCATDAGFEYFVEGQRNYLRSMVAYPLTDCRPDGVRPVRAALLIDTNVAGYFRTEDRLVIESRLQEFALRLELEYATRVLTT